MKNLGIERVVKEKATLEIIELLSFFRRTVISIYNDKFLAQYYILGLNNEWIKGFECRREDLSIPEPGLDRRPMYKLQLETPI
jgi:hypothetical protein